MYHFYAHCLCARAIVSSGAHPIRVRSSRTALNLLAYGTQNCPYFIPGLYYASQSPIIVFVRDDYVYSPFLKWPKT